jgi:hypothetical protein
MPLMIEPASIVFDASLRTGAITTSVKFVATSAESNFRSFQRSPSAAAVMEPPETLEMRASLGSHPRSFR